MKLIDNSSVAGFIRTMVMPIAMIVAAASALPGQQAIVSSPPQARALANGQGAQDLEVPERLFIGPGDLLNVTVFGVPELQQTVRVSETGDAALSLIGKTHLGGMTTAGASAALEDEYRGRKMLVDPHITVLVTEYATEGISVLGEVTKPGVYPLLGPHSLLDIISAAGGLTQLAGSSVSIRRRSGAEQVVQLDANDPQKALAQDVELQPADTVVVSRAAIAYVVGDVGKPGGFPMQNNGRLTILQAIALASGVNKTAALRHSKIIRKTSTGYEEIDIHLAQLLQGKSPDRPLQPEDIVFVPNSRLKSAVAGGYTAAVQAATSAVIYAFRP
jgi:polysaccharide export outer membrane protein